MRFLTICFHALVTAAGSRAIVGLILNTKRMKRRPLPSCAVFYSLSPLRSPEKKVVRATVVDIFFESTSYNGVRADRLLRLDCVFNNQLLLPESVKNVSVPLRYYDLVMAFKYALYINL